MVGGDFNIQRYSDEKNKNFCGNRFSDMFNWIINSYEMREIALNGGKYTKSNNHVDPTLEKLDKILMNDKWETIFPLSNVRKIPRYMSDHNPMLLGTNTGKIKKTKGFCFETSWIKHADFLPKMKEIWEEQAVTDSVVDNWHIKLNRVKKFLKGWGLNLKGQTRRYKLMLQKELDVLEQKEEENMLSPDLLDRKTFIQTELMRLLEEEELYWHKRSNTNWLLKGDNNTDYFHKKANGKKRRSIIFNLDRDGECMNKDEEMIKHATEYYKNLFGPSDSPTFSLDPDCWEQDEKVNNEENESLIRPFSEEEIKKSGDEYEKKYSSWS
jgi:hypothetical protein